MDMDWEDLKRGYIAAVLHELTTEHSVTEADAHKLIDAYGLRERLDVEPVVQLHMSILGVVQDMRREGLFEQIIQEGKATGRNACKVCARSDPGKR